MGHGIKWKCSRGIHTYDIPPYVPKKHGSSDLVRERDSKCIYCGLKKLIKL